MRVFRPELFSGANHLCVRHFVAGPPGASNLWGSTGHNRMVPSFRTKYVKHLQKVSYEA
jgi:hypothetical protein